jgi:hypothetical protein
MRRLRLAVSRKGLAATNLSIGALLIALTLSSMAVASATTGSSSLHANSGSSGFTFYTVNVDGKSTKNNYVTGINSSNDIVGAYLDSGTYYSFLGIPTTPSAFTYNWTSEQYSDGTPLYSTFLQGLTDHANTPHVVGYAVQSLCLTCPTFGLTYLIGQSGPPTVITDPKQGTTPCNVTEVLGINNSRMGVGYYETNTASGCAQQAFEYYCPEQGDTCTGPYQYFDLNPLGPNSAKPASSVASGINGLGDVTGTITMSNGQTYGWFYAELRYNYFSIGTNNTFGRGINFDDYVVGSYTNNGVTYGFLVINPQQTQPSYTMIDNNNASVTVVNSMNLTTNKTYTVAGWFQASTTSKTHGFVAMCSTTVCKPSPASKSRDQSRLR